MRLTRREVGQLCALIVLAIVLTLLIRSQRSLGQNVADNSLARAVREDRSSPDEGDPAADLTLIVFTDYRCPACRAAHPAMKRAVATDRKIRIVYKDWPIFGAASERAAQIAIASNFQGIYPLVHDRMMSGPADSEDALHQAVEQSGGDWRRLQEDLATNRTLILAQLVRNRRQASELGLAGTPGYLVGPILVRGALSEAEFTRVFREARELGLASAFGGRQTVGTLPAVHAAATWLSSIARRETLNRLMRPSTDRFDAVRQRHSVRRGSTTPLGA